MSSDNQLVPISTSDLNKRIKLADDEIEQGLMFLYENHRAMTPEEIDSQLETIGQKEVARQTDVNILKFRTDLQEKTIDVINERQAGYLKRLDELETKISNGVARANKRVVESYHKRSRNDELTGQWAAVRGNGRH